MVTRNKNQNSSYAKKKYEKKFLKRYFYFNFQKYHLSDYFMANFLGKKRGWLKFKLKSASRIFFESYVGHSWMILARNLS